MSGQLEVPVGPWSLWSTPQLLVMPGVPGTDENRPGSPPVLQRKGDGEDTCGFRLPLRPGLGWLVGGGNTVPSDPYPALFVSQSLCGLLAIHHSFFPESLPSHSWPACYPAAGSQSPALGVPGRGLITLLVLSFRQACQ